jgi:hypothetical protein
MLIGKQRRGHANEIKRDQLIEPTSTPLGANLNSDVERPE